MMNEACLIEVDVQSDSNCDSIPKRCCFQRWAEAALRDRGEVLLSIRLVDREESAELNRRFRSKPGPTNVLSFAAELPAGVPVPLLGDIVICAPLVMEEAANQGKEIEAHWAHLVIHGILHLLGFDHHAKADAEEMEAREVHLLASLGYPDPYA
jgi:probable rRNA maturation factor